MLQNKELLINYQKSSSKRLIIFSLCPPLFLGLIVLYFRINFEVHLNLDWKANLLFAVLWITTLLIFLFNFIQLILYKKVLSKEKNGDFFSHRFKKIIKLKIIFMTILPIFALWIASLISGFWLNNSTSQISFLVFKIFFTIGTTMISLQIIYCIWLYFYNDLGSKTSKIIAIICFSWRAYKKIIILNSKNTIDNEDITINA